VAPGLDGVVDVTVIADPMVREDTEEKGHAFTPTEAWRPGSMADRRYCRKCHRCSLCLWGMSIGAVPIKRGHHLGWPGEHDVALGCRALGLLIESDAEEPLRLVQSLVGLRVRRVGDVFQAAAAMLYAARGQQRPLGALVQASSLSLLRGCTAYCHARSCLWRSSSASAASRSTYRARKRSSFS
jgi:hypothetical protein